MGFNTKESTVSKIYLIGKEIREKESSGSPTFLKLNQGVNRVHYPEIEEIIKYIDFKDKPFSYPPPNGLYPLRDSINKKYFSNSVDCENIVITPGSVGTLDILFQLLDVETLHIPTFFWGPYKIMADNRGVKSRLYQGFSDNLTSRDAIIICDPNNPTGEKVDDDKLLQWIEKLDRKGVTIIFDSPYRALFTKEFDPFYNKLTQFKNLVIVESFSKCLSLPGGRVGFIYSPDSKLTKEISSRLLYISGGVNIFSQLLVKELLVSKRGIEIIENFKEKTTKAIRDNLEWLDRNNLIERSLYSGKVEGLFAIVNRSERELMDNYIGAVELPFFTIDEDMKRRYKDCSRICLSVDHNLFREYFERIL